jgi:MarR family 2-MHQ and catechol resistance regulon transcriptional repressor
MPDSTPPSSPASADDFPASPARDAVVAVVRGFGTVQRLMEPYFARFGLTPPQFQALTIIHRLRRELLSQRRLARELYVSFPNITVLLRRLERKGLIDRRANAADRREKFVRPTSRGKGLLRRIWRAHQRQLDRVMAGLTPPEQGELARLLNKMMSAHSPSAPPLPLPNEERVPC